MIEGQPEHVESNERLDAETVCYDFFQEVAAVNNTEEFRAKLASGVPLEELEKQLEDRAANLAVVNDVRQKQYRGVLSGEEITHIRKLAFKDYLAKYKHSLTTEGS